MGVRFYLGGIGFYLADTSAQIDKNEVGVYQLFLSVRVHIVTKIVGLEG